MSELTGQRIALTAPNVELCSIDRVKEELNKILKDEVASVHQVFSGAVSAALLAPSAIGAGKLNLHIGHTGLTWIPLGGRITPPPPVNPMVDPQYTQAAIRDIAGLGFYGIELFGNQIEAMEAQGGVGALLAQHKLPLISAYCSTNLSDPAARKDAIAKTLDWAKLVKKYNGKVIVIGLLQIPTLMVLFYMYRFMGDLTAMFSDMGLGGSQEF